MYVKCPAWLVVMTAVAAIDTEVINNILTGSPRFGLFPLTNSGGSPVSKKTTLKPIAVALGVTFAVSLIASPIANAAQNPFNMTELSNGGYMVAEEGKCGEGKAKTSEGKCGEGKAEASEGKCGEGKAETREGN